MIEQGDPLFAVFSQNVRRVDFQVFFFVAVRSLTADSSLLTPHTSHFRSVNLYKEFSYRLKVNKFGALTTSELVSRHTEQQANNV